MTRELQLRLIILNKLLSQPYQYYYYNKVKLKRRALSYYYRNRDRLLAYSKRYRETHRESYADYLKEYHQQQKTGQWKSSSRHSNQYLRRKGLFNQEPPITIDMTMDNQETQWYKKICENICRGISSNTLPEAERIKFWDILDRKVKSQLPDKPDPSKKYYSFFGE